MDSSSSSEAVPERDSDFLPWEYISGRELTNRESDEVQPAALFDWAGELAVMVSTVSKRGFNAAQVERFLNVLACLRMEGRSYVRTR